MTGSSKRRCTTMAVLLALGLLSACTAPTFDIRKTEVVLPLNRAWIDGRVVEYVTTDISDPGMAKALGVNAVPRLAQAITAQPGHSVLERVYKFANNEQISIFQSAPLPAGSGNRDPNYSPLWRMVLVHWVRPGALRELKSEEELLAAEERKELTLQVTGIVVNCPVVRGSAGEALHGVR